MDLAGVFSWPVRRVCRRALARAVNRGTVLGTILALAGGPPQARASCDLIPSASNTFRGAIGSTDRPFARPGDLVELQVLPPLACGLSQGFPEQSQIADVAVTIVFTPPNNGPRNVVVVATDCTGIGGCACTPTDVPVNCLPAMQTNQSKDLDVVERDGGRRLKVRFPDTHALLPNAVNDHTFTGPVTIAVKNKQFVNNGSLVACELVCPKPDTQPPAARLSPRCADLVPQPGTTPSGSGLVACVDELFVHDGTCETDEPRIDATFGHFTALPPANDYQALCNATVPPCKPSAAELRATTDAAGNLLIPMNWSAVIARPAGVPAPRLLRAMLPGPPPLEIAGEAALASYTVEGAQLPPIFAPGGTPGTLFGSADAPASVLRIAPGVCASGSKPGAPCGTNNDCGANAKCMVTFDFRDNFEDDHKGPLIICGASPHPTCTWEVQEAVPLEGIAGSQDLFVFSRKEAFAGPNLEPKDLNGDFDTADTVVTLLDRRSGQHVPIGDNGAAGRAVTVITQPPFALPAVSVEGNAVAFLEAEAPQGNRDANGDGDVFDSILRVFRVVGGVAGSLLPNQNVAVDAATRINEQSVVVSNGLTFVRRPEAAGAPQTTVRISVDANGIQGNDNSAAGPLPFSADGRFVGLQSVATNLVLDDTNGVADAFIYDRDADGNGIYDEVGPGKAAIERVSVDSAGGESAGASDTPALSANGRVAAFASVADDLVAGDTNGVADIFVRDLDSGLTTCTSLASNGGPANGPSTGPALSSDAQFVAFASTATNLVPGDGNGAEDVFVRNRAAARTVRVSVTGNGAAGNGNSSRPVISASGRFVAFESDARDLTPDHNQSRDIFVHDSDADGDTVFDEAGSGETATVRVNVATDGTEAAGDSTHAALSADGRFVAFASSAANLVPDDTNGFEDVFIHDRDADGNGVFDEPGGGKTSTVRVSMASDGTQANGNSTAPTISADGRLVAFNSGATNLVIADRNRLDDAFVHDRITGMTARVSLTADGMESRRDPAAAISPDGRFVALTSDAFNLVPGDLNGRTDVFVRGVAVAPEPSRTLLQEADAANTTPIATLGAADAVAVAGGAAAFLQPEAADGIDLNGDPDADDEVVQLWQGNTAQNLGLAATAVSMSAVCTGGPHKDAICNGDADCPASPCVRGPSCPRLTCAPTWIAALTPAGDRTVVTVHAAGPGTWFGPTPPQAAAQVRVCGSKVVFITPEAVLQIYDPATNALTNTQQAAEDFVCNANLVAFRTREAAQGGQDLNRDGDTADDVLQVYDFGASCPASTQPTPQSTASCPQPTLRGLHNTCLAVTPCFLSGDPRQLTVCDPRQPYRVIGSTVKFLTLEADQGTDLNNDNDTGDLVIERFNVCTNRATALGAVVRTAGIDPLRGDPLADPGTDVFASNAGRCIEDLGFCDPTTSPAACPSGAVCEAAAAGGGRCERDQGVCVTNSDCPPKVQCRPEVIVVASADTDGDGVSDAVDNCPTLSNPGQEDTDQDGVGNLCDQRTCQDGITEPGEECDGTGPCTLGADPCRSDCTCPCTNVITDPGAHITLRTRREAGRLAANVLILLSGYDNDIVSVRLDGSAGVVAKQTVGALSPRGRSGKRWQFKVRGNGLQRVTLSTVGVLSDTGTQFRLKLAARKWFSSAAGSQATRLTINIGSQCFSYPVTPGS